MGFWAKLIAFITPPPTQVDEVAKAKVIKKAVKEATVTLDKFKEAPVAKTAPKRARTKKGTYKADDMLMKHGKVVKLLLKNLKLSQLRSKRKNSATTTFTYV